MPVHLAARDKVALFIPNGQYDPHTVHSNLFGPSIMICPMFSRVCIFEGMGGRGTFWYLLLCMNSIHTAKSLFLTFHPSASISPYGLGVLYTLAISAA